MKLKKTVTAAVRSANRANSQKSTGPKTDVGKATASGNSIRHGILARKIVFATRKQRLDYQELLDSLVAHFKPQDPVEKLLAEELANTTWKLAITEELESKELARGRDIETGINGITTVYGNELHSLISGDDLLDRGWDCERMVVRATTDNEKGFTSGKRQPLVFEQKVIDAVKCDTHNQSKTGGHLEIEAVLSSCLGTLTRYRSTLKRDLYRAIDVLHKIQEHRREREQGSSASGGPSKNFSALKAISKR